MRTRRSLALAVLLVTGFAVVGWLVTGGPNGASSGLAPLAQDLDPPRAPETEGVEDLSLGDRSEEATREGHTEVVGGGEEPSTPAVGPVPVLSGRVVSDPLGSPLAGVKVTVTRRMHSEFWIPNTELRNASLPVASVVTNDAGRFEVAVPAAVPLDVKASAREHATARRDHVFAGDDVEFRLTAAAILEGVLARVVDASPVEGALVLARDGRQVEQGRASTDGAGRFLLEDLPPGLLTIEVTPMDAVAPPSQKIEMREGVRSRLDLLLESGVRIHGVVSDPQGQPIANAEVGQGASFHRSVRTDAEGWYEIFGLGKAQRRDLGDLRVRAEGHGAERRKLGAEEIAQDSRIDFLLHPARVATGRVVDAEDNPIEGAYVAGIGSKTVEGVSRSDWESTLTGSDGRFELATLHVQIDHQLFLRKEGYGTRVYDFPADESEKVRIDYGDLVLHSGGRIEGLLKAQTGTPLPDHLVKLRGTNTDLGRFRPNAEALEGTWMTTVRHSRTDTQGRFHFTDLPGGELQVTASVQGKPESKAEATVELPEGERVADVELTLDLGNPITGLVRAPDGSPAIGVFVQVAGDNEQPRIRSMTGAGGRFELLGVTEDMGAVELFTIVASYNWSHPDAPLAASRRVTALAGEADVVLALRDPVRLSGRVEDPEGDPAPGVKVLAYLHGAPRGPASVLARATSDGMGGFQLDLPEECHVDIVTPEPNEASEPYDQGHSKPTELESVPSNADGVVLRIAM